ncbi:hypothetical protein [uncultured Vagococcus sp.]|uniref:hypothetical protein n=1 Tax=uncultured Vagococcus sp. TaxID=189676 RepID=UPI0028D5C2BB|nr:hypothetical protein [uncultured Vagococcus sp.]
MNLKKQSLIYVIASLGLIATNYVYSLFSHGVSSESMSGMWHYTAIMAIMSGALGLLNHSQSTSQLRLTAFLINCGVAALVSGLLLKGIVEIAGTNSDYIPYFQYSGWALIVSGTILGCYQLLQTKKHH